MSILIPDAFRVPQIVACSCGRKMILDFNGSKYIARNPLWKFRTVAEADEYERSAGRHINCGWYCGEPDHEQQTEV
jgi:hypothetical protein